MLSSPATHRRSPFPREPVCPAQRGRRFEDDDVGASASSLCRVQLVEVATGHHRWSQRFDRGLDEVFAIQDKIAESVATSLRGGILSRPEKQALLRPQTGRRHASYLHGRQHLPRMTQSDLEKSGERKGSWGQPWKVPVTSIA